MIGSIVESQDTVPGEPEVKVPRYAEEHEGMPTLQVSEHTDKLEHTLL